MSGEERFYNMLLTSKKYIVIDEKNSLPIYNIKLY